MHNSQHRAEWGCKLSTIWAAIQQCVGLYLSINLYMRLCLKTRDLPPTDGKKTSGETVDIDHGITGSANLRQLKMRLPQNSELVYKTDSCLTDIIMRNHQVQMFENPQVYPCLPYIVLQAIPHSFHWNEA